MREVQVETGGELNRDTESLNAQFGWNALAFGLLAPDFRISELTVKLP